MRKGEVLIDIVIAKKVNAPNRRVYFLSLNILKMQQNLHNLQDEEFEILRFFGAE